MGHAWAERIQQEMLETLDPERADILLEALRPILAKTSDPNLQAVGYLLEGDVRRMESDLDGALEFYALAVGIAEENPDTPAHVRMRIHNRTAIVLARRGDHLRAREEFVRVRGLNAETWGERHRRTFAAEANVATICMAMDDRACARERLEGLLAEPEYIDRGAALTKLGRLDAEDGETELAESRLREGIALLAERHGERAPHLSASRLELFNVLHTQGRSEEALVQAQELVAISDDVSQEPTRKAGFAYFALGRALTDLGRWKEAERAYTRALETRRTIGATNARVGSAMLGLAAVQHELGAVETGIATAANAIGLSGLEPIDLAAARLYLARNAPEHPAAKRLAVEALRGNLANHKVEGAREAYAFLVPGTP